MCNIHAMEIIPNQQSINVIALYREEFDNKSLNYHGLLVELKEVIDELDFMKGHNTTEWMQTRGVDYLSNPKLFCNAPLTCLCAFLGELFNRYDLDALYEKLSPQILKCALTRLAEFKQL